MNSKLAWGLAAATVLALALVGLPRSTEPTPYPDPRREVRHVIPWRAGGSTDAAMRGFAGALERHLGARIVTENVPGGLSSIGLSVVQRARPDGYTLGTMTYDALTVEILGLAPVRWRAFEPICTVTLHPSALIVRADRWADLDGFRREALERPRALVVGNVGTRGIWHQHAAAMAGALGIELRHVPYEGGSGPQLAALLGGEVDAIVSSLPAALAHVRDGSLRVLGVMSPERDALVPDAPTFRERGHDLVYGGFRMLVSPRGVPEAVLARLEAACRATARDEAFTGWAEDAGVGAAYRDRAGSVAYLEDLAPRVRRLIAELDAS